MDDQGGGGGGGGRDGRRGVVMPFVPRGPASATSPEDQPLPELWRRFWTVRAAKLKNPNTRKGYRRTEELSRTLGDRPTMETVELWAARLLETHPGSAYLHVCKLGALYDLALRRHWTPTDPVAEVREGMPQPQAESHPIRDIDRVWPVLLQVARDASERALLGVYRFAGLRPEEAPALVPEDVLTRMDPWQLSVTKQRLRWSSMETVAPKGRRPRLVPVRPELRALLAPVLAAWRPVQMKFGTRHMPRESREVRFLFPLRAGDERDLRARLGAVAPEHFGPRHGLHTFRHTLAFELYSRNVETVTISEWLGHKNILTTEKYLARMAGGRVRHDPAMAAFFGPRPELETVNVSGTWREDP